VLSDVTIVITAGSRPGYLRTALHGINLNLPECKRVVVNDDGQVPRTPGGFTIHEGTIWRDMPTYTFLTTKRNAGVALVDTKYTLIAADDFEFDIQSRATLIRMAEILESHPFIDVITGRVNERPYEGFLTVKEGEYIKEIRFIRDALDVQKVDIAANFFLARTKVLRQVPWDEAIGPIGGEHADWFLDMKAAGAFVAWAPGLNINEQAKDSSKESPDYRQMRGRAMIGHELMLKKRGVKKYYGFDEQIQGD
jgi:hypothetical protein